MDYRPLLVRWFVGALLALLLIVLLQPLFAVMPAELTMISSFFIGMICTMGLMFFWK